jgi:hypothetical protein
MTTERPRRGGATESARPGAGPLAVALVVLCGALGWAAVTNRREAEDPHLATARRLVARYEEGRAETARDYESPAYVEALAALARVPAGSAAYPEAAALAQKIRARVSAQRDRARARQAELARRQAAAQRRDDALAEATRRRPSDPAGDAARCEDGASLPEPEPPGSFR